MTTFFSLLTGFLLISQMNAFKSFGKFLEQFQNVISFVSVTFGEMYRHIQSTQHANQT